MRRPVPPVNRRISNLERQSRSLSRDRSVAVFMLFLVILAAIIVFVLWAAKAPPFA